MEGPEFRKKYEQYKIKVKKWEKEFIKKYKRIPSKYDIKEAPADVKYSYKMYYKLKTSFLEKTFSDILSEDGFDVSDNENSQEADNNSHYDFSKIYLPSGQVLLSENTDSSDQNKVVNSNVCSTVNYSENEIEPCLEPVLELEVNKKRWVEVSKSKSMASMKESNKDVQLNMPRHKSSLNAKLFKSTRSFSMRNPRKSLSRLNFNTSSSSGLTSDFTTIKTSEILPDLETILLQKAKEQKLPTIQSNDFQPKKPQEITVNLDPGWLNRCSELSELPDLIENKSLPQSTMLSKDDGNKFGLSNIDIGCFTTPKFCESLDLNIITKNPVEKTSIVENIYQYESESDEVVCNSEDENGVRDTYRHIAKRRRILRDIDRNKINIMTKTSETVDISKSPLKIKKLSVVADDLTKRLPNAVIKSPLKCPTSIPNGNLFDFEVTDNGSPKKDSEFNKDTQTLDKLSAKGKTKKKKIPKAKYVDKDCKEGSFKESGKKLKVGLRKTKPKEKIISRTSRSSQKSFIQSEIENEKEYQPLTLNLELGKIKSLPSVNFDELKNVGNVVESYIIDDTTVSKETILQNTNFHQSDKLNKLQAKVRSGTLNENFVRIDINKKVYVRGKRSVNFSRYKKKLWRHKKELLSISGPGMDMRGCDGGIKTCYKCGLPGHFSRQCEKKGDSLFPLDAEEVESPFLTLKEAAEKAQNTAVAVHSRNISKLPEVSNIPSQNNFANKNERTTNDIININGSVGILDNEKSIENVDESYNEELMKINKKVEKENSKPEYIGHKIPEEFLEKCGLLNQNECKEITPIYDLNDDGTVKETTTEVMEALNMFGHTSFRKGQEKAVMRILSGVSTLVTLSTGSGKSLCYQLPAYLYSRNKCCITLVISPLVSLMEDQVHDIPTFLRAYCLHTNQTPQQRLKIMNIIAKGEIDILLVSPEAVVAGERSTGFGALLSNLPPIAFACIDEVHCVSQWSHNFRPSYLMICKVLKKKLGVKTILGLTATATFPTKQSIIQHLEIQDGESGIISDISVPDNLILSVSIETNRDNALIQILKSERFENCQSIIIYCTRRDECERVAGFIRTCLQNKPIHPNIKKRKRINWQAEPYHAGLPASRRRMIQNAFMRNELRIVVATIAFGMGINKSDIRAIIHYNMPKTFESYVQEIGRAGRDGKISHCHLFLDAKEQDRSELNKHIFENSIDRHVIRKLLQNIFNKPCACINNLNSKDFLELHQEEIKAVQGLDWTEEFDTTEATQAPLSFYQTKSQKRLCPGHEIGFSIQETVQSLDIPEENISTLLCYLELDGRYDLHILSNAYTKCKILSYRGSQYLKTAAKDCPPLATAIALQIQKGIFDKDKSLIEFDVIEIAAMIGWNSGVVKHQLKSLEWISVNGRPKRSPISVTFYNLGFRVKAPGDFTSEELDNALDSLYQRSVMQERLQLIQLQYISEGLHSVAFRSCYPCCELNFNVNFSNKLKSIIRDYFQCDVANNTKLEEMVDNTPDSVIVADVQSILQMYPENTFTGRSIARIFYGIGSPNYPPVIWGKCKYWRAHMKVNFNRLVKLANEVIVRLRM